MKKTRVDARADGGLAVSTQTFAKKSSQLAVPERDVRHA